jgi:hypothetical protein
MKQEPNRALCLYHNTKNCSCIKPALTEADVEARRRADRVNKHFMDGGTKADADLQTDKQPA